MADQAMADQSMALLAEFDVVVVGAGVVGTAVARLLSHHRLAVALVDSADDVGTGTSKANTAILHTGFDATPGTIESRLVARGYALLSEYAPTAGISIERTGALLVAWDDEQAARLVALASKATANGYLDAEIIDAASVGDLEPNLGPGATGAMLVPGEHIIDPWGTPLAFAREAIANAVTWIPEFRLTGVEVGDDLTMIAAADGRSIRTRFVVNAAGLFSDTVDAMFGGNEFAVRPRRGELIVFDKLARPLLTHTILPVPTTHTKGVLIAPTVFGNVMLGPTADDIDDRTATGSTEAGVRALLDKGRRILPSLLDEEVTAVYAGLRAATEHADYQIRHDHDLRYVCLGGIRSTGLTSSMALAEEALARLRTCGLDAVAKDDDHVVRPRITMLGEADIRPYQVGGSGAIVCHCERVTRAEITSACSEQPPATSFDGIRRRTRALAGRCQGFYCSAEIGAIAAESTSTPVSNWIGVP